MDTALVFAGTSFVGRHLLVRLGAQGVRVAATSRAARPGMIACDLTQPEQVADVIQATRPRWIFQCAGATAQALAEELSRLHEEGTRTLLMSVMRHAPAAVVVLFGSAAEYGCVAPAGLPVTEDTPAMPRSPYGMSKLVQYHIAERLTAEHGLRVHVVRPFNLLGPGLGKHYFAAALCERLRERLRAGEFGSVPIHNAEATRDWVDGRDVADAVVRLAFDSPPASGCVGLTNIASGIETANQNLADHLCRLAGDFHAVAGGETASRTGIDRSKGSSARLRAATGWEPRIDWRASLRDMWSECVTPPACAD